MEHEKPPEKGSQRRSLLWVLLLAVSVVLFVGLILWPALNRNTGHPPWTRDLSQARQIGVALYFYMTEHEDIFPIEPGLIIAYSGAQTDRFFATPIRPYQGDFRPIERSDPGSRAERYGDYVFLMGGVSITEIRQPSETIMAYTAKVSEDQERRSLLYADGHVESVVEEAFREVVPPEVDVDYLDGP